MQPPPQSNLQTCPSPLKDASCPPSPLLPRAPGRRHPALWPPACPGRATYMESDTRVLWRPAPFARHGGFEVPPGRSRTLLARSAGGGCLGCSRFLAVMCPAAPSVCTRASVWTRSPVVLACCPGATFPHGPAPAPTSWGVLAPGALSPLLNTRSSRQMWLALPNRPEPAKGHIPWVPRTFSDGKL